MEKDKIVSNIVKLGLVGNSKVGTTSICNRFMGLEFTLDIIPTIGIERNEKKLTLENGKEIKLEYCNI